MKYKKLYVQLYLIIGFVVLIFLILGYLFRYQINISFFDNLFAEQNLPVTSYIVYLEGRDTSYSINNEKRKTVKYNTPISRKMTIQTGKDSIIAFYIKDHGYYYLYPNSILFIDKIEYYSKNTATKETRLTLEKGRMFADLNFYSDNSYLIMETSNLYLSTNKAKFIVDKIDDFQSNLYCLDGEVYFRPYSGKIDFYRNKKIYVISSSIERLINTANVLKKNQRADIKYSMSNQLDDILNKIYESSFLKNMNKDYIASNLIIPKYLLDINALEFEPPNIDYRDMSISNISFLELRIGGTASVLNFMNRPLKDKNRYIFLLSPGLYKIEEDAGFIKKNMTFSLSSGEYKHIDIKRNVGLKTILINSTPYPILFYDYNGPLEIFGKEVKNRQIVEIGEIDKKLRNIYFEFDVEVKNIYVLQRDDADDSSLEKVVYNGKKYSVLNYLPNINNKSASMQFNSNEPVDRLVIAAEYDDVTKDIKF
ncbi:MAG TPA: FecR domain-containing protein [Spirochaetota bacterium]|nr:FecR domain-containing protein [Spirochaetota bacterium]HOS32688.1 FecR domain-containing protein [Spirochaetota bacterium]HOS56487.1 FecR domain-containing protein [Spirochaetota bacterium]HQF78286.1 FecR domain-containing protein [Spirochaetota bacterium]HQH29352.1 FecR domain-containing protein [Spirochaetota bacterium]